MAGAHGAPLRRVPVATDHGLGHGVLHHGARARGGRRLSGLGAAVEVVKFHSGGFQWWINNW